jgi:formylglycine-generating enzyme
MVERFTDVTNLEAYQQKDASVAELFSVIPSGDFLMGSDDGQDEEQPTHRVYVSGFEIGIFPVRNRDYQAFVNSSSGPAAPLWQHPYFSHPDQPVVAVSWFDASAYCQWLSKSTNRPYRLPTEAEWERAARGGHEGLRYVWGNEKPQDWPDYVRRWTGEFEHPLVVGSGAPNGFGLYDMCENIHEWCSDWFSKDYYSASPPSDPRGPSTGDRRASRGGSWRHQIKVSRSAGRSSIPPEFQYSDYGFRIVRERSLQ